MIAVGTGQALKIGEHGDCDVVFVDDRPAELAFVDKRLWRRPSRDHVQRLYLGRPESASPRMSMAAKTSLPHFAGSRKRERRSSRAATTAAPARPSYACGRRRASTRRHRMRAGTATPGRQRAHPQHGGRDGRLYPVRPRDLAQLQEQAEASRSSSKATGGCSTNTASCS